MNPITEALLSRCSEPRLSAPSPAPDALELALACAARAPDHALLRPWRYLVIEGEGLERLGELFEATAGPDASDAERQKLRRMPLRAPMMLVAIASPVPHPKVPAHEQEYSCAASAAYLILALQAEGYGAMWRTGALAEDPLVSKGLGLSGSESIVGFIYTGTVVSPKPAIPRPDPADIVSTWPAS